MSLRRGRYELDGFSAPARYRRLVIVGHYEREGEIKIDDTTYSASEREIARRERMKREG